MDEQQTLEDEVAEIKLRIALKLYDSSRAIRIRAADVIRPGAEAQTPQLAARCIHELSVTVADIWTEEESGKEQYVLRSNKRDWIEGSVNRTGSHGVTWADRVRTVLSAVDRGQIVPGERARLWNEAFMNW